MELTYENIEKWMREYFETYNSYAQNPDTVERMNDYFMPDMEFIPYVAQLKGPKGSVTSRDDFYKILAGHPSSYETFVPEDITIDEKRNVAVVIFGMQVVDTKKEEVVIRKSAIAHYKLVLDENDTIKIKEIKFFWEVMPPGQKEFYEIFGRDD